MFTSRAYINGIKNPFRNELLRNKQNIQLHQNKFSIYYSLIKLNLYS